MAPIPDGIEKPSPLYSSLNPALRRNGLLGYHGLDVWDQLRGKLWSLTLSDKDWAQALKLMQERGNSRGSDPPLFGRCRDMNVVLLQVESLQGFVIDLKIDGQEITPHLNALARKGVYFSLCTNQTASGRTSDAVFLSESSLLPLKRGAVSFLYHMNHFVGLADILHRHGYATLAAKAFKPAFWNAQTMCRRYGFRRKLFEQDFAPARKIGIGLSDRGFLGQMLPKISQLPQPFLSFMVTLSLHHPFLNFPEDLKELDLGRWEGKSLGGYLHGLHYFDTALGEFLEGLERSGLAENTILVIWGDHDAGADLINDRDMASAVGISSKELDHVLADRVPLVMWVPGESAPRGLKISNPAGLWDVTPTVAALLGINTSRLPWLGRDLLNPESSGLVVRSDGGWIDQQFLLTGGEDQACYDWRGKRRLDSRACEDGSASAARILRLNEIILQADIQERLKKALEVSENGPQ